MYQTNTERGITCEFPHIDSVIDNQIRCFFSQILTDGGYIEENHTVKWEEGIMPKMCQLINTIPINVFNCDGDYSHFNPCFDTSITINEMMENINLKLTKDFKESPPFTIHRIVELLTFNSKEIQLPHSNNAILERIDNGTYLTIDKNVMSGDETSKESINNYYRPSMELEKLMRLNDIYAMRYLFDLKRSIFVQSNTKRVLNDLRDVKSINVVGDSTRSKEDIEKSDYPVKLEKIPWLKTDKDIVGEEEAEEEEEEEEDNTAGSEKTENTTVNMDDDDTEESIKIIPSSNTTVTTTGTATTILFKIKGDVITENNLDLFDSKIHQSSPKRSSIETGDQRVVKRTRSSQRIKDELETSISNELNNSPEICDTSANTSIDQNISILDSPHVLEDQELEICS